MNASHRPHRHRAHRGRLWLMSLGGMALCACYSGDFFDRLVNPDAVAAFRITTLTLIDPHTYSGNMIECVDSTDNFNSLIAASISSFDTNTTLVLRPLDPLLDTDTDLDIVPAMCVPGGTLVNCTDKGIEPTSVITADFNNSAGGTCGNPVAGSLNPRYMTEATTLNKPTSPCFLSALIPAFSLQLTPTFSLPLSNVQIYAAYELEETQRLVDGVLFGFLPASAAMVPQGVINGSPFIPWSVFAGGNACQPDPTDPIDDVDTVSVPKDGVWMYFNFTAERVAWSSEAEPTVMTATM